MGRQLAGGNVGCRAQGIARVPPDGHPDVLVPEDLEEHGIACGGRIGEIRRSST